MAFVDITPKSFGYGDTRAKIVAVEDNANDFVLKIELTSGQLKLDYDQRGAKIIGTSSGRSYPNFDLQKKEGEYYYFGTGQTLIPMTSPGYIKYAKNKENIEILRTQGLRISCLYNYKYEKTFVLIDLRNYISFANNFNFTNSLGALLSGGGYVYENGSFKRIKSAYFWDGNEFVQLK